MYFVLPPPPYHLSVPLCNEMFTYTLTFDVLRPDVLTLKSLKLPGYVVQ